HHQSGGLVNQYGFLDDKTSTLYMSGESDEPITVADLKRLQLHSFAAKYTPLILLNACATSQGQDFFPSGFIPYFTGKLRAAAVIGTLAEVPARHALSFARDFVGMWFGAMPAAEA